MAAFVPRLVWLRRAAVNAALAVLLIGGAARAQSLAPTGYWQYNGTGTVTGTLASSGTNATGVMSVGGTAAPSYTTTGMVGSAVQFSYATQPTSQTNTEYLSLNASFGSNAAPTGGYALGSTFSLSTWFFISSLPTGNRSYLYEGATTYDISAGSSANGGSTLITYVNSTNSLSWTNGMATGTWRNIVQTFSTVSGTTTMVTYLDGVASGTTSAPLGTGFGDSGIFFGTARGSNFRPLNGLLDETAVWANQALTATQALDVYNRGLAGVSLTNTNAIRGYLSSAAGNAWLTGANWGGTAPGVTANAASTNGDVAVVGNYAFSSGLGIDMGAAAGNLALGAITFNSLAGSGSLSIGNSAATNGTLTLNGAQIDGNSNVILNNEGLSDLRIENVLGTDAGQRMVLQLGSATNAIRAAPGRTLTVASDIIQRTAGSTLSISGGGLVVLSGSGSYTGATTVSQGTLQVGAGGTSGSLASNIANAASLVFSRSDTSTYAGQISGSGSLDKQGAGTLVLAGTNTLTGAATVSAGTLVVGDGGTAGSLGGVSGVSLATGTTLAFNRTDGYGGSFAPAITGSGAVAVRAGSLSLAAANSFTGGTLIAGGTATATTNAAFGTGAITLAGGGLQLSANSSLANDITLGSGTNTIGGASNMNAALSGRISGSGRVTSNSAGRLTLSGENTFSGGLVVASGTIQAANPNALGAGIVTLGNGATLAGTGTFSCGGLVLGSAAGDASTVAMTVTNGLPDTMFSVAGDVVANGGPNTVTFAFGSGLNTIATGTYPLVTHAGSLSGASAFTFSGSKGGRQGIAFADTGTALNLVVSNAYPIWNGANGTGWSTTDNWRLNADSAPTSFQTSDTVLFADGALTGTVALSAAVAPLTTTVNADVLDYTFVSSGGQIASGSLTKSGLATLTIDNSNSFGGGTTLAAGALRIGNDSALGSGAVAISGGRLSTDGLGPRTIPNTLSLSADVSLGSTVDATALTIGGGVSLGAGSRSLTVDSPVTFSGGVSNGDLVKAGSGTLVLSADGNTYGATTINAGTLQVGSGGTTGSLGTGAVVNNSALVFARTGSGTYANPISGAGAIRAVSGTTSLSGTSTFTGPITIDAGALLGTGGAGLLGGGSYAGAIATEGDLTIGSSGNQTLSGVISGGGRVLKSGAGTLTLSAANSFAGGVSLAAGTVSIADAAALGAGPISPALASGGTTTLNFTSAAAGTIPNAITLGDPGATARTFAIVKSASSASGGTNLALSGPITGGGTAATLFLDTSASGDNTTTFTLSGSNTFRGTIQLNRGAIVVSGPSSLGDPANTVYLNANANPTLGDLRFATSGTFANPLRLGLANNPVGVGSSDVVITGIVSGSGLTKLGSGKLTFAAANTYTTTTISAGVLEVGSGGTTGSLGSGAVTNNATLAFNRSDNYGGPVANPISGSGAVTVAGGTVTLTAANSYSGMTTIAAGATLQVGNAARAGAIGSGGVTNDGTLAFARTDSITFSNAIVGAGEVRVGSGLVAVTATNSYAGNTTIASGAVLQVGSGGTSGALGPGGSVANSGTLVFNRSDDYGGSFTRVISGTGGVAVSSGALRLGAANTHFGNTTVAAGATLALGDPAAVQNSTLVAGGAVAFVVPGTATYTLGGLSGGGTVNAGGNTLAVGGNDSSTGYSGNLTAAALVKQGAGTLTLTGSNTIGATTITGGEIFAGSNNALGAGAVTLAGGLLRFGKGVTIMNDIVLAGAANAVTLGGGLAVDYLVVGGGGGGGGDNAGGGGGGGVLAGTAGVGPGAYGVTVGAGGAGGLVNTSGSNGGNSSVFGMTAFGGGGGAGGDTSAPPRSGGSGGGGDGETQTNTGGWGIPGQGFAGGSGFWVSGNGGGGGGGGAGAAGISSTGTNGGAGGSGVQSFITGGGVYYGGGGGAGSSNTNTFVSSGGLGGGGSGKLNVGDSGTNGLGGGGGGGSAGTTATGGSGGSGVVIVRYPGSQAATGGTVTSGTGSALGYTLHTFSGTGQSSFVVTDPVSVAIAGVLSGTGGLTWNSAATLQLSGRNTYTGDTVVSAGTLVVNGDQSAATGPLRVAFGATLGGAGTIGGATAIEGLHALGSTPALQTFQNGLEYRSTGQLRWNLFASTVDGRGTNYDAIDLTSGALGIDSAAMLELNFGSTLRGSTVNWDDTFWGSSHAWTVIATSGSATWNRTPFSTLVVGNDTWGRSLTSVRPDGAFSARALGDNLIVSYEIIPEPTGVVLAAVGAVCAAGWVARGRKRRPHGAV